MIESAIYFLAGVGTASIVFWIIDKIRGKK